MTAEQWDRVAANVGLIWWSLVRLGLTRQELEDGYDPALDGLMAAARAWRPGRGAFGTYAAVAIRNRVVRFRDRREARDRRRLAKLRRLYRRGVELRGGVGNG
jgi:DNA-directed RNA polymerase specialized sigma subunit